MSQNNLLDLLIPSSSGYSNSIRSDVNQVISEIRSLQVKGIVTNLEKYRYIDEVAQEVYGNYTWSHILCIYNCILDPFRFKEKGYLYYPDGELVKVLLYKLRPDDAITSLS